MRGPVVHVLARPMSLRRLRYLAALVLCKLADWVYPPDWSKIDILAARLLGPDALRAAVWVALRRDYPGEVAMHGWVGAHPNCRCVMDLREASQEAPACHPPPPTT